MHTPVGGAATASRRARAGAASGCSGSRSCARPLLAVQAAASEPAAAPAAATAQLKQRPAVRLTRRHRPLSWPRWERRLYQQLLQQQQEQALLAAPDSDAFYYSYYDCPDAHLAELQDSTYQATWARAIAAAGHLLKGAIVLDVGCGLGMLSMLAAQAGAKHVYAVDASPGAAELARKVIAANGLSGRISVITGRAEAVALPLRPNSVDVVLSSWMGSMLLHEGLLPALMRVRDRWLAPHGVILPDAAQLHIAAIDDRQYLSEQSRLWTGKGLGPPGGPQQGGGWDMRPALNAVIKHPRVDTPGRASQVVTDAQQLLAVDVYRAQLQDLSFSAPFTLTAQRAERVSGLAVWWDAAWTCRGRLPSGIAPPSFTTAPAAPPTSWLQLLFSFPRTIPLEAGQQLSGHVAVRPAGLPPGRMLDVDVEVQVKGMTAKVAYQLKR